MIKIRLLIVLLMFTIISHGQQKDNKRDEFLIKAEVTGKGNVQDCSNLTDNNSYFLRISLINNMDTAVSFWMMNCSWVDNWLIDNANLRFCFKGCDKNFPVLTKLESKTSMIFYGIIHKDYDIIVDKFKLGFVMYDIDEFTKYYMSFDNGFVKNKITYWSDYIQLIDINNRYKIEK